MKWKLLMTSIHVYSFEMSSQASIFIVYALILRYFLVRKKNYFASL